MPEPASGPAFTAYVGVEKVPISELAYGSVVILLSSLLN